VRLGKHGDKRRADQARRLLGWIACALTPPTVEEAQQALVVDPGNRDQIFRMVAKLDVVDVVDVLGPIVEITDTCIHFIHFAAKD
jgi:hypothetical protein